MDAFTAEWCGCWKQKSNILLYRKVGENWQGTVAEGESGMNGVRADYVLQSLSEGVAWADLTQRINAKWWFKFPSVLAVWMFLSSAKWSWGMGWGVCWITVPVFGELVPQFCQDSIFWTSKEYVCASCVILIPNLWASESALADKMWSEKLRSEHHRQGLNP